LHRHHSRRPGEPTSRSSPRAELHAAEPPSRSCRRMYSKRRHRQTRPTCHRDGNSLVAH
jgi:hypothetical protein